MPTLFVEVVRACSLVPGTVLPDGCNLQPDCTCGNAWSNIISSGLLVEIFTLAGIMMLLVYLFRLSYGDEWRESKHYWVFLAVAVLTPLLVWFILFAMGVNSLLLFYLFNG